MLTFLTEKNDGRIKSRSVFNGEPTREWLSKDDSSSPTVSGPSLLTTLTIDAKEGRDVMSADVLNTFTQAEMPERKPGEE